MPLKELLSEVDSISNLVIRLLPTEKLLAAPKIEIPVAEPSKALVLIKRTFEMVFKFIS